MFGLTTRSPDEVKGFKMKLLSLKYMIPFFTSLILLFMAGPAECAEVDPNDPNNGALISLDEETKKVVHFAETVYWPDFDFKNVQNYIIKPDPKRKTEVSNLIKQIIAPNYLVEDLPEKIRFLKAWRGKDRESFVLQYENGPYIIRVKNQETHIQVTKTRRDTTYWIAILIQAKDKSVFVDKRSQSAIFSFTDKFLDDKINSKAQDYSNLTNMDKPAFMKLGRGVFLIYPVDVSRPRVDAVIIWTDGRTLIINLQERRKVILAPPKS